MALIA